MSRVDLNRIKSFGLKPSMPQTWWIRDGYKLPLQFMPSPLEQGNHKSALGHCGFVTESVQEWIKNRCAREAQEKPLVCNPLSVIANREGKLRLVLNLRHLNQYLRKDHFKYEDLI